MSESTTPTTANPLTTNHDPDLNDVYRDNRTDDLLRLIYIDEYVAFLRVDQQTRRGDGWVHRMDTRSDFDDQLENDRLTPAPDAEIDAPSADYEPPTPVPDRHDVDGVGGADSTQNIPEGDSPNTRNSDGTASIHETDWGRYASDDPSSTDSESTSTEQPETRSTSPSGDSSAGEASETDREGADVDASAGGDTETVDECEEWSQIPHIGAKTEENLYDHGFETPGDIKQADADNLEAVPQLGPAGIANLRDYVADRP